MANTKSAIKNARKSEVRRTRNKGVLTRLKSLSKKVATLKGSDKTDEAKKAAIELSSALDKAAKTGIIHKNLASRKKSQVSSLVFAK
jgi:small subunit ribosomal protein S20